MQKVYVGMGGNLGPTREIFRRVKAALLEETDILDVTISPIYNTTPMPPITEGPYFNAVCGFHTSKTPKELYLNLKELEEKLGRVPGIPSAPRPIDLDLLLYGEESYEDEELTVPHPRWRERLFVLKPLSDLVDQVTVEEEEIDLKQAIMNFDNRLGEEVVCTT